LGISVSDHIFNNTKSPTDLISQLEKIDFLDEKLLRPDFDTYFIRIAMLVAKRSNCFRRAVGAVIVKERKIISTGYNGTPFGIKNCNEGGCQRCAGAKVVGKDLDKCICIHAEENAVIEAGRQNCKRATIYTTTFPCLLCTKTLVHAGVDRVVYYREYDSKLTMTVLKTAYMELDKIDPFNNEHYTKV